MAGEGVLINVSDVISSLPPYLMDRFDNLVMILGAVGIAFIVYVGYVVVKMILGFKHNKKLKILIKKVDSLERKIDILVKGKKHKTEKKSKK